MRKTRETGKAPEQERILIISANNIRRHCIKKCLFHAGYDVFDHPSADEIKLKIAYARPHLIIMDMHLPGTTACHILHEIIRKDPEFEKIPVLIIHGELKRRRPKVEVEEILFDQALAAESVFATA